MRRLPNWLFTSIVIVVVLVWAVSIMASLLKVNGYQPPDAINAPFAVVLGGIVFGRGDRPRRDDD
jgi:hypothetical protein